MSSAPRCALRQRAFCPSVRKWKKGFEMWQESQGRRPWAGRRPFSLLPPEPRRKAMSPALRSVLPGGSSVCSATLSFPYASYAGPDSGRGHSASAFFSATAARASSCFCRSARHLLAYGHQSMQEARSRKTTLPHFRHVVLYSSEKSSSSEPQSGQTTTSSLRSRAPGH